VRKGHGVAVFIGRHPSLWPVKCADNGGPKTTRLRLDVSTGAARSPAAGTIDIPVSEYRYEVSEHSLMSYRGRDTSRDIQAMAVVDKEMNMNSLVRCAHKT
jgi:hypothetical protein